MLDGVEEGVDVGLLATDEPDGVFAVGVLVVLLVFPRQHAVHEVPVDGDVVVALFDGGDDGEFDLGVSGLVAQDVDQFVDSHDAPLGAGTTGCSVIGLSTR